MDASTQAVRELYELFPYPSGAPALRLGFDARYLLSLGQIERPAGRPLRILDAGCSRGVGALGCATLQPDVEVLGVDINRVALEEARSEALKRGLSNLAFAEVDLSTLEGLQVPEGGFDVIISSGVLHHLVDPAAGLRLLKGALAPHGVLSLMIYSKTGRREILAISHVIDSLINKNLPLLGQLVEARMVVQEIAANPDAPLIWKDAVHLDDVEFVDRYLHIQERVFDVPELFELIEQGGLSFLRWTDPPAWRLAAGKQGDFVKERAQPLDDKEAARLVDNLGQGPAIVEVYLCHPENQLRPTPAPDQLAKTVFAAHPEVRFQTMIRNTWCATRVEAIGVELRAHDPVILAPGPMRSLALALRDQNQPFLGEGLFGLLSEEGHSADAITSAFLQAIDREWVYCPHPVELG